MVKTPVLISGDVNTRVESHFSKVPSIATDAFTKNFTVLSPGVIAKTGACARVTDGSTAATNRQRTANRIEPSLNRIVVSWLCVAEPVTLRCHIPLSKVTGRAFGQIGQREKTRERKGVRTR